MKYFFILLLSLFLTTVSYADDIYKYRHMGKMSGETIILGDKSTFNHFSYEGAFSDDEGSFGDIFCRGIREADSNDNLVNLNVLCELESKDGDKFWARSRRKDSSLEGGAGYIEILSALGKFKKLLGAECSYAVSFTKKGGTYQETKCTLASTKTD